MKPPVQSPTRTWPSSTTSSPPTPSTQPPPATTNIRHYFTRGPETSGCTTAASTQPSRPTTPIATVTPPPTSRPRPIPPATPTAQPMWSTGHGPTARPASAHLSPSRSPTWTLPHLQRRYEHKLIWYNEKVTLEQVQHALRQPPAPLENGTTDTSLYNNNCSTYTNVHTASIEFHDHDNNNSGPLDLTMPSRSRTSAPRASLNST